MVLNARKTYQSLLALVLIAQLYLPSYRYNIVLQFAVLGTVFYLRGAKISIGILRLFIPLAGILVVACVGPLFKEFHLIDAIKDFTHLVKPVLGLALGYFLARSINDLAAFVKTLIYVAIGCAVYHFVLFLFFANEAQNVSDLRLSGIDNFLELFALVFVMFSKKLVGYKFFPGVKHYLVLAVLSISCFIYFSRTMIVVFICVLFSIWGYTKLTRKSLQMIGVLCASVALMYAYLFSIKINREGNIAETFFYKVKNAPLEIMKTKIDRQNHADLWDHWRGYEVKRALALMEKFPGSYVFGNGYGSLVNLKFYAPLGDSKKGMRYISELHNGYVYVLYKTGLLGLALMMVFLYWIYLFGYLQARGERHLFVLRIISAIAIVYVLTAITITGIFNARDIIIFILGGLLYFEQVIKKEAIVTKPLSL